MERATPHERNAQRIARPWVPLRIPVAAAVSATRNLFDTFTSWCAALNLLYATVLIFGSAPVAHRWLFPIVHFNAWAVLVGSHVLLYFSPETLHAPRIRGREHLRHKSFTLLAGHEILHVLPVIALSISARAWPNADEFSASSFAWGTGSAVILGTIHALWQVKEDNPYRVGMPQMKVMMWSAVAAGLTANLVAVMKLS